MTKSVAPLSNNTSTMIPSYVSILSNPIFTVTSLNHPSAAFLTSIPFLIPSDSDTPTSISLASTLNLLQESS